MIIVYVCTAYVCTYNGYISMHTVYFTMFQHQKFKSNITLKEWQLHFALTACPTHLYIAGNLL